MKTAVKIAALTALLGGAAFFVHRVGYQQGVRDAQPRNVVTVAMYADGTYSADAYSRTGELLTTAHMPGDARLANLFPVGCQPDDGDMPCATLAEQNGGPR